MSLIVLAFASFAYVAYAQTIDESQEVSATGTVKIKNLRGDIRIEGWDQPEVRIEGDLDELSTGLRFDVDGDKTEIEVKMPRGKVNWGDGSDLVIQLPENSRVLVDTVATDLVVENLQGGAQLRSVSGEIELSNAANKINLSTVSGQITVNDTKGDLIARSSSGEILVKSHTGSADVETMSGEVELVAREAKRLRGSTVSGEIEADVSFLPSIEAEFSSVSGEILVTIEDPVDLSVFANTVSGDIENDLTDDKVKDAFGQNSLRAVIGDGSGSLSVRAVSGEIRLEDS